MEPLSEGRSAASGQELILRDEAIESLLGRLDNYSVATLHVEVEHGKYLVWIEGPEVVYVEGDSRADPHGCARLIGEEAPSWIRRLILLPQRTSISAASDPPTRRAGAAGTTSRRAMMSDSAAWGDESVSQDGTKLSPSHDAATVDDEYVYAPPTTRKAKDGYGTRQELLRFARAFRYAVEAEFIDGGVPPLWLRNGYDNAREITGLDRECWPAPWERES